MAKRKRSTLPNEIPVEFDKVQLGPAFSKFGLPEVDSIIQNCKFGFKNPNVGILLPTNVVAFIDDDNNNKMEDCISKLPDDILQSIISFLDTREGARTCILSTRWKYLWSKSASSLNLTYANMFGYDYHKSVDLEFLVKKRVHFRQRVDQLLQLCKSPVLDVFRVSFVFTKESAAYIDRWMKFVAVRGVKELELDFGFLRLCYRCYLHCFQEDYRFPVREFGSSLKYLHLKSCIIEFPCDFKGFGSLVSMALDNIFLTENVVQNILSNCSSLEWLSMMHCRFMKPTRLKFVGPSLLLKHLHISIRGTHLSEVEIVVHDINLLSFELLGRICLKKVSIKNAPLLKRYVVDPNAMRVPFGILSSVPHLQTLFFSGWFAESSLPALGVLNKLKQLVFLSKPDTFNLHQLVYFLEACPLLQKLELDMGLSDTRDVMLIKKLTEMIDRPGTHLTNLKEVGIYGFEGFSEKIELAKYLLKNATALEKMKIYTISREYLGNGQWVLFGNTAKQGRIPFKKACKLLQKEASSSIEFTIESTL